MYNWSYFDKIYCISTKDSYLRRTYFNQIAKDLNMKVEMKIFDRHPEGSNKGCTLSHFSIIKDAFENNYNKIIIFEDDIVEAVINKYILDKITTFLSSIQWDLFYFGAVPDCRKDNICEEKNKGFYRIRSLCTHSYAMNRSAIEKYKDLSYFGIPIDYLYRDDIELKSYAHFPTQFFQETAFKVPQFIINNYFRIVETYAYYIGININHPLYRLLLSVLLCIIIKSLNKNLLSNK
jgi:GR25 family glycosyltransferase involved in LPS biosynthesis